MCVFVGSLVFLVKRVFALRLTIIFILLGIVLLYCCRARDQLITGEEQTKHHNN